MDVARELAAYLALAVAITTLMGHWRAQRKAAMDEGGQLEKITRMKEEMNQLFAKMRKLEEYFHLNDKEMEGMKRDISYIKLTVDEIKQAVKSLAK
jgi:hypothetical protein